MKTEGKIVIEFATTFFIYFFLPSVINTKLLSELFRLIDQPPIEDLIHRFKLNLLQ